MRSKLLPLMLVLAFLAVSVPVAGQVATLDTSITWAKDTSVPYSGVVLPYASPTVSDVPMVCTTGASGIEVRRYNGATWDSFDVDAADTTGSVCTIEAISLAGPWVLSLYVNGGTVVSYYTSTDGESWVKTDATTTKNGGKTSTSRGYIFGLNSWAFTFAGPNIAGNIIERTTDGGDSWSLTSCATLTPPVTRQHYLQPTSATTLNWASAQDGVNYLTVGTTNAGCVSTTSTTAIYDVSSNQDTQGEYFFGQVGLIGTSTANQAATQKHIIFNTMATPVSASNTLLLVDDAQITNFRFSAAMKGNDLAVAYLDKTNQVFFLLSTDGGLTWIKSLVDASGPGNVALSVSFVGDTVSIFHGAVHYSSGLLGLDAEGQGVGQPSEFDSGLIAFAISAGFISAESQMLFAMILIGLITVATGSASRWVAAGRFKNYLLFGMQALVAVFFVVATFLELWMFLLAFMLGLFAVRGAGEVRSTFFEISGALGRRKGPEDITAAMQGPRAALMEVQVNEGQAEAVEQRFRALEDAAQREDSSANADPDEPPEGE